MNQREEGRTLPSQGSGSFLLAKSSIENLTSTPFSMRVSGSAFMSQYWRPVLVDSSVLPSASASALGFVLVFAFAGAGDGFFAFAPPAGFSSGFGSSLDVVFFVSFAFVVVTGLPDSFGLVGCEALLFFLGGVVSVVGGGDGGGIAVLCRVDRLSGCFSPSC